MHGPVAEPPPRERGFTPIKLFVAVAIVGILLAIAVPSYQSQVRKSARAEAQAFINNAATRQQQFLVDRRSYATSLAQLGTPAPADLRGRDDRRPAAGVPVHGDRDRCGRSPTVIAR